MGFASFDVVGVVFEVADDWFSKVVDCFFGDDDLGWFKFSAAFSEEMYGWDSRVPY